MLALEEHPKFSSHGGEKMLKKSKIRRRPVQVFREEKTLSSCSRINKAEGMLVRNPAPCTSYRLNSKQPVAAVSDSHAQTEHSPSLWLLLEKLKCAPVRRGS